MSSSVLDQSRKLIRLMLVDDADLMRGGVRQSLASVPDMEIIAECAGCPDAVGLARRKNPDVILADLSPSLSEWTGMMKQLAWSDSGERPKVIVLTSRDLDRHLFHTIKAGASGFLLKNIKREELVQAIRAVAAGDAVICPTMTRRLLDNFDILPSAKTNCYPELAAVLSDREIDVLRFVALGHSNREIARDLRLTTATIKSHVSHILTKLGMRDRVQIALVAFQAGLLGGTANQAAGTPLATMTLSAGGAD